MEEKYFYLCERHYNSKKKNRINNIKYQSWKKLLGERLVESLYENKDEIRAYFNEQEWNCRSEFDISIYRTIKEDVRNESIIYIKNFLEKIDEKFSKLYEGFLTVAYEGFIEQIEDNERFCTKELINGFLENVLQQMKSISMRILIEEMNENNTKKDKFSNFIKRLQVSEYVKKIFIKYPVLERCLWECASRNVIFFSELFNRIVTDKTEIEKNILKGHKIKKITGINGCSSDLHFSGRQVIQLEIDNEKSIIYKPHSIENEKYFDEFLNLFGNACGIEMYLIKKVIRKDYGWLESVEKHECVNIDELRRYYYRVGIIIFISYLLGTNDIHCENIIAFGEFPVVIDLENIVSMNAIENIKYRDETLNMKLKESVINSGILPNAWKEANLSAISGGNNSKVSFKIPVVKQYGSDNMHIGYENYVIRCDKNRATLNGEFIVPGKFEEEILRGFETAYCFALNHKKEIKKRLESLQEIRGRYLISDTQKYFMLLSSSYHPYVMKNAADREFMLYSLWRGRNFKLELDSAIVEAEIYDLIKNDIPYFYFYLDKTDLYDSRGFKIKNYFYQVPRERLYKKLELINPRDMRYQKLLINLSLSVMNEEHIKKSSKYYHIKEMIEKPYLYSNKKLLSIAESIGEKLLKEAVYSKDKSSINWFSISLVNSEDGTVNIQSCGNYLYDGLAGILIYMHMLSMYSERKKYVYVCKMLEKQLFLYTENICKDFKKVQSKNSGIYNGEGSIVYAYLILFWMSKKSEYIEYAEKHMQIVIKLAKSDKKYDLLDGIAGAIVALCYLYQATDKKMYLTEAEEVAKRLMLNATIIDDGIGWKQIEGETPLLGMAHGNAGILMAFSQLYKLTNKKNYYSAIIKALRYERSNYNCEIGDWIDFRATDKKINFRKQNSAAWCHGAGGILLSRLTLSKLDIEPEEREELNKEIERAYSCIKKNKLRKELCLCHGVCGNLLIISAYEKDKRIKHYYDIDKEKGKNIGNNILTKEWFNPGLMNGYTGIGYYFLMQIEELPNFIFLHDENNFKMVTGQTLTKSKNEYTK